MCMEVIPSCLTLYDPKDCSPSGSSVHGILQARIPEWVARSCLQGIFQTQGSNPGLPHRRRILYRLSHQKSPNQRVTVGNVHSECVSVSHSVVSDSCDPMDCSLLGSSVKNPPGKITRVGCHFLLQGSS